MNASPRLPDVSALAAGILGGDRAALARAITLVESRREDHRERARTLVQTLLPHTGGSIRLGITGVPGAGKSTLIDALGMFLIETGHRVAVLAVDPSSTRTGGSILGDKTRMSRLSGHAAAFVRPSPTAGTLGGVAARTREALLLCEAAGFDVTLIETVGVGQSETAVADLVDVFLVLMLAGAGDELQGIKKGVLELADIVAVNKTDGANQDRARAAAAELRQALHLINPAAEAAEVVTISGLEGRGLDSLWRAITALREARRTDGGLEAKRRGQQVKWLRTMLQERVLSRLDADARVRDRVKAIEAAVAAGTLAPLVAVEEIAALLGL